MGELEQSVVTIESRDAVRFGHGWIIEGSVNEILECVVRCRLLHDRLTDVNDFSGIRAKAVNAQNLERFAVE